MAASRLGPEQRFIDAEANHGADEVLVLGEGFLIDADVLLVGEELLELVDHRVVDFEVARHVAAMTALDARVAFGLELLREVLEDEARVERAAEARRVEALDRPREVL